MNILALLTVFFGLVTIGLYCVICVLFDRNEQLRQKIGTLPPPPDLQAALDLIAECELLERRNDWLEQRRYVILLRFWCTRKRAQRGYRLLAPLTLVRKRGTP